jgi:uncharacterized coiled-coil protein SlyX
MNSMENLQAKREQANKIVLDMVKNGLLAEENLKKSNRLIETIRLDTSQAKTIITTLNKIVAASNDAIDKFRNERDKVSTLLKQVNNFYDNKYLPLVEQIHDKETGIKANLTIAHKAKTEILKAKSVSAEQYEIVKEYASELKKKNRQLLSIDTSIRKLLEDTTAKNKNVDILNKSVVELEKKITKTHDDFGKLYSENQIKSKNLSNFLSTAEDEVNEIQKNKNNSDEVLKNIQEIYDIAAETGLSGEFDRKSKDLKIILIKWENRILYTSTALLAAIILMFLGQLTLDGWDLKAMDVNFYLRFLITSPIIYYLYLCSKEYSETKMLFDKYSFKTTLAMSIRNHIQLLTEQEKFNTPERIDGILSFILDGFKKIYTEPHVNTEDNYKMKLKLANMELKLGKSIMEKFKDVINIPEK